MRLIKRPFKFAVREITQFWLRINKGFLMPMMIQYYIVDPKINKINLCSGNIAIPGYCSVDLVLNSDLIINLSKGKLPFRNDSIDTVICISGINYFERSQGEKLIGEIFRVLKIGGIARFGVQDLKLLARKYVQGDCDFYFQKLPNGRERFEGPTLGDKFVSFFYRYTTIGGPCRYFYDYESLEYIFHKVGFVIVEQKAYLESRLPDIEKIDNRPDQMFFLEAVK